MDHLSENCPNDFPFKVSYKPLSMPPTVRIPTSFLAKDKSRPQSTKVAAISRLTNMINTDNTARVAATSTTILNSGSNRSESDDGTFFLNPPPHAMFHDGGECDPPGSPPSSLLPYLDTALPVSATSYPYIVIPIYGHSFLLACFTELACIILLLISFTIPISPLASMAHRYLNEGV